MYSLLFLAGTSFASCALLTPVVRAWSRRSGWLDYPNDHRKTHRMPVPRVGGVAIVISYLVAVGLLLVLPFNAAGTVNLALAVRLIPSVLLVFAIGLADDLMGMNPKQKLLGQVAAAVLAWLAGIQVTGFGAFAAEGWWWSLPLTTFWLVGCANAINLIDGVDGLAAGIGLFATMTTLAAALLQHNVPLALATAPLAGGLIAFLFYNFSPASIFLGDSGSLTIGFLLGCFGVIWSQKAATALGMAAPLMALAIPLLDTGLSIVRRFIRHQPIFKSDRNHVHHRLLDKGFSPRRVALTLYGACGIGAAFSLLAGAPHDRYDGVVLVAFCVAAWVGIRLTGYVEFDAARHLVLTGTFRHILNARLVAASVEQRITAARTPAACWEIIREVGRELGCAQIRMEIGGTVYHDEIEGQAEGPCCTIRIQLVNDGYINFRYYVQPSVRHAMGISALVEVLQRSLTLNHRHLHPPQVPAAAPIGTAAAWSTADQSGGAGARAS